MLIEDYALVGDLESAALVSRAGSVDWLCLPRFDSPACLAGLLGEPEHGSWELAPATAVIGCSRRYLPGTLVLETRHETPHGTVLVLDFMPRRGDGPPRLMRIVQGVTGRVPMRMRLRLRPDYGAITPWVERAPDGVMAVAGPDAFRLSTPVPLDTEDASITAEFSVSAGASTRFALGWWPSHEPSPPVEDADSALARTQAFWRAWTERGTYRGEYAEAVQTSLIALKAMISETTGALVAAPTTSLPEDLGGVRNWDYRYCWLRDSVLTLDAMLVGGYLDEALRFRDFLLRVATGNPTDIQIMYGIGGERRLTEFELPHLPGYEQSPPVRVGNAASEQFQLDVYGEVMSLAHTAATALGHVNERMWPRWRAAVEHVAAIWREPDDGIWESRGPRRHYTYSKVMAWVVFDRAIRLAQAFDLDGPVERWTAIRNDIHREVCQRGFDEGRGTFTQSYESRALDASALTIPLVGFLPGDDERVTGTIDAVRRELGADGLVARYSTRPDGHAGSADGLPGGEGQFLACSFWLVSALALNGRVDEARELFERLLSLRNDVGLLAEEYDVGRGRQVGNFPQAFSHLALIEAAQAITASAGTAGVAPLRAADAAGMAAHLAAAAQSGPRARSDAARAGAPADVAR
ncbi:MAG TPA: glycoside hydrolase family 15 protein [Baekduia sp.]|nr:glycoside hydrolase family 15 protein [Baekduia sp.]